jgi:hypothetical protein
MAIDTRTIAELEAAGFTHSTTSRNVRIGSPSSGVIECGSRRNQLTLRTIGHP